MTSWKNCMAGNRFVESEGLVMDQACISPSQYSSHRFSGFDDSEASFNKSMTRPCEDQVKTRERSTDRNPKSEFEFVLSIMSTHESTTHGVGHMLAADQLFFKGKLLPLYVPECSNGSELPSGTCNVRAGVDEVKAPASWSPSHQVLLDKQITPHLANHHADNIVVNSDLSIPASLKATRYSIKLKCLFGLKKLAGFCCSCAISADVSFRSFRPAKFFRKAQNAKKKKHRSAPALILQQNVPLSINRATQLSYQSDDVNAQTFTSEPLLSCCKGGKEVMSIPHSMNASTDPFQAHSHNFLDSSTQRMTTSTPVYSCNNAAHIVCKQRSNNGGDSLAMDKIPNERTVSGSSEDAIKLTFELGSYEKIHTYKGFAEGQCRRSSMHDGNRGKVALTTLDSCVLLNAANGSSKGQQAALGTVRNGFKSLNVSRVKSLERSQSYSPKSLQRKYDHLKLMRQREGWRALERSSSYNGSMYRMRIAPVLNVPIVCMSRSKSVNNAADSRSGSNLFSKRKNIHVNFRVMSTKSAVKDAASAKD